MNIWQKINSYMFPVLIDRFSGDFHSELSVYAIRGKMSLFAENTNYSFGRLHRVFQIVFQKMQLQQTSPKKVLILGFGTGSVAHIIHNELQIPAQVIGIEKDKAIIEAGKKWFDTDQYPTTEIRCDDAFSYIKNCQTTFDLIVCDIFVDIEVPKEIESPAFIKDVHRCLSDNGQFVLNKIVYKKHHKLNLAKSEEQINELFSKLKTYKIKGSNRVLVALK